MKCPVCGKYASDDSMKVAEHMMRKFDEPHIDWMEAHGLKQLVLNEVHEDKKGNYKPLAQLLDKIAMKTGG
jgi:hypothetical protein